MTDSVNIGVDVDINIPIPQEDDWDSIIQEVGAFALERVRENFGEGGRAETWRPLVSGGASYLFQSGALLQGIQMTTGQEGTTYWARVETTGGLPYAEIHQFGGVIEHPGSTKSPIPMVINGELIFRWMKDPFTIEIPARPYMVLTEEDEKAIAEMGVERIAEIINTTPTKANTINRAEEF